MSLRALYVCYLSLEDPLVHSQVVAYLEGLAQRGHTVHLLTFEPELTPARRERFAAQLREKGIAWHGLRYHKRPSLPATVYDVFAGTLAALQIMRRHRLDAIHARNHVPAAMALMVRRLTGCRLIFDVRGLMADEYVDAGIWRRGGIPYRLTNWVQRLALQRAQGVVVLTEAVVPHLGKPAVEPQVIPCCVDLERLAGAPDRAAARVRLGIGERPVMVYVGKLTGWYMDAEMVDFFHAAREVSPDLLFLVITQGDRAEIEAGFARRGISSADYLITRAEHSELGGFLAAADYGISFVRPCFSKISSSPTKVPEYLAAGLPLVATSIGDMDTLFATGDLGVLVDDFSENGYREAAHTVARLAADAGCAERCRTAARRHFSLELVGIPRYDALYQQVAAA